MSSTGKISKKVILLGHFGVGKTSLVRRFVHSKFSEEYQTTIGVKVDKKVIEISNRQLTMIIWDIEGGASQKTLPKGYFLGAHGILYVFDLTRPSTYAAIEDHLGHFREMLPKAKVRIIGNKKDLLEPGKMVALETELAGTAHAFSSAKTGEMVEEIFEQLGLEMLKA